MQVSNRTIFIPDVSFDKLYTTISEKAEKLSLVLSQDFNQFQITVKVIINLVLTHHIFFLKNNPNWHYEILEKLSSHRKQKPYTLRLN